MESSLDRRARWEEIFRGYDVRGRYPEELDRATARCLGWSLGRSIPGPFLVGRDTRWESEEFERALLDGLRSTGTRVEVLGIVPTPTVAFLARARRRPGLAVTPSHNALGFVGLKGFTASGHLFDREWRKVARAFGIAPPELPAPPASPARERGHLANPAEAGPRGDESGTGPEEEYLAHVTRGLRAGLGVVVDTRGGAVSRLGPVALRRLGARVVHLRSGFSPRFFGRSPEPLLETLRPLSNRVLTERAAFGCAFDGDGDRCVLVDERGRPVAPELVALLLHRTFADSRSPLVASVDASRILERWVRTVRSRVGGRYVVRTMRRAGAEVAVEPSGHFYVRRFGADSDGLLTACLVAHALEQHRTRLGRLSRQYGRLFRGSLTLDFPDRHEMGRAYLRIRRRMGGRVVRGPDGFVLEFANSWCLVRCSNTQPSVRIAYESSSGAGLRGLQRSVQRWTRAGGASEPSDVGRAISMRSHDSSQPGGSPASRRVRRPSAQGRRRTPPP